MHMQAVYTVDGGGAAVTTHKFKRPKTTTADRNIHNCNILILAISVEKSSNSRSPVRARNKRVGLSARGALHARPLCLGEEERERERERAAIFCLQQEQPFWLKSTCRFLRGAHGALGGGPPACCCTQQACWVDVPLSGLSHTPKPLA